MERLWLRTSLQEDAQALGGLRELISVTYEFVFLGLVPRIDRAYFRLAYLLCSSVSKSVEYLGAMTLVNSGGNNIHSDRGRSPTQLAGFFP